MVYEKLDQALRQLKVNRERADATKTQQKEADEEATLRFARIKSTVVKPIFDEIVARLAAEGFFAETVGGQDDASGPISLNVNLSEDEECSCQGSLQLQFDQDQYTCEFGKSTMARTASTNQLVFGDKHRGLDEITEEWVHEVAEQFVLDLVAGKIFR